MGIDFLDMVFRLEKEFGLPLSGEVRWGWSEPEARLRKSPVAGFTAGQLHDQLCAHLVSVGRTVPADSWDRVRRCIAGALSMRPSDVRPEHRLIEDLDFS